MSMTATRVLSAACLLLIALHAVSAAQKLHVDYYKDAATAATAHSRQLRTTGRKLTQTDNDTVCYEGCLVPPVDDPAAAPLPVLLLSDANPIQLLDCYNAAVSGGYEYFAIANITSCYGGNSAVLGWALSDEDCPLNCIPDGPEPKECGAIDKASVFSMGLCPRLNVSCNPDNNFLPPSPPNSPLRPLVPGVPLRRPPSPRPPRPPPTPDYVPDYSNPDVSPPPSPAPPPPAEFTCRDGTSLWGDELTKIKLSTKNPSAVNADQCKAACASDVACQGFYYKTTQWCYLMSVVRGYKTYGTSYRACKKLP